MASGTATVGMTVARALRRKTNTTSTTRPTLRSKVSCTSRTEARMVPLRSSASWTSMAGEMALVSCGRSAFTRSMTSMMFAPGWRRTIMTTERLPSNQPATRVFSTRSTTRATSRSRTGLPFEKPTMSGSQSAATRSWSLAAMACDWAAPSSAPLGALAVACPIVARKLAVERPAPASAAGSTCTRTAGCCPPPTKT